MTELLAALGPGFLRGSRVLRAGQRGRARSRRSPHAVRLGDRDRGRVDHRADARRRARASHPGREPARRGLRRGHSEHTDPRPDLHALLRPPRPGIRLEAFTVAWLAVTIWGGAFNTENFRAGFEAVPARYREASAALGFRGFATFANITLPIGGRIALPSSINTYISVVKNTSLMYVISYPEITTTVFQIQALTLETVEAFTVLALTYLIIVWSLSALIRLLESHLALPEDR